MIRLLIVVVLSGFLLVGGCRTLEPEPVTPVLSDMPGAFVNTPIKGPSTEGRDKRAPYLYFKSTELETLLEQALKNNFDLLGLRYKIEQEEAVLQKKMAGFFPSLGFSFSGKQTGTHTKTDRNQSSSYDGSPSWDASVTGSYDLDVWGKLASEEKSQRLNLEAALLDLKTSELEVISSVTQAWIDIIATRSQKGIIDQQIEINETLLNLQKLRYVNGKASALDVSQQRETLAESESQRPLLEKKIQLSLNSLGFLLGKNSAGSMGIDTKILPSASYSLKAGVPTDLLENRPDIQSAWARLQAARQDLVVARADRLPSFSITAQALFSSGKLDLLFQNWVASLAAAIAGPVFDGGLKKAEVERVRALARALAITYARTVASAVKEVEDALVSIQKQDEYIELLEDELAIARLTLKDAMVQYQNGKSSYLAYLTTWTSIERLERQLIGEKATRLKDQLSLAVALGRYPKKNIRSTEDE